MTTFSVLKNDTKNICNTINYLSWGSSAKTEKTIPNKNY